MTTHEPRATSHESRPWDWEARLARALCEASQKQFSARRWNCAIFAHDVAQRVSGRALPFAYKESLAGSVDAVLPRVAVALARRGDVVMARIPEASLGVCNGREALFVAKSGLLSIPMRDVRLAWSV